MVEQIALGKIVTLETTTETAQLDWNQHPSCKGVALKHLVTSQQSGGKFSSHLVKVEAGCEISAHVHPDNWELHEVVSGTAIGYLADQVIPYASGTSIVIPQGVNHRVVAGAQDLYLLAKFVPALV